NRTRVPQEGERAMKTIGKIAALVLFTASKAGGEQNQGGDLTDSLHCSLSFLRHPGTMPPRRSLPLRSLAGLGYSRKALNSRIPFIAAVFPISAAAAGDAGKIVGDLDALDIFCLFVA